MANGPIYLAKEDNVQSEQTIWIICIVADSVPSSRENINPATIGDDYSLEFAGTGSVVEFPPAMQRVNFKFTLLPDDFPEGTEAFRLSISSARIGGTVLDLPNYSPPIALFTQTFVFIEDNDDCKCRYGKCFEL